MPALLLGALRYWRLVLVLGLLSVVGYYVWQYNRMHITISRQSQEIVSLEMKLQARQFRIEELERVTERMNRWYEEERARSLVFQGLTDQIHNAPEEDNAPVAPVLRDALTGLDGLLRVD